MPWFCRVFITFCLIEMQLIAHCKLQRYLDSVMQYHGDRVFRIEFANKKDIKIENRKAIFNNIPVGSVLQEHPNSVDIHVPHHTLRRFSEIIKTEKIHARLLIDNVADSCNAHGNGTWKIGDDFYTHYHRLPNIYSYMDWLIKNHSDTARLIQIGKSFDGRPIKVIEITNNIETTFNKKKIIVLSGGVHAREWISPHVALYIAMQLLKLKDNLSILNHFAFAIAPLMNPDGYVYTWENDRMWRKTRSSKILCQNKPAGVDFNRNWDFHWKDTKQIYYRWEMEDPCSEVYAGPTPFSEKEVVALRTYLSNHSMIEAYLEFHSYGQVFLPPWSYQESMPPDEAFHSKLCKAMINAIKSVNNLTFECDANYFPSDPGTGVDYAYGHLGIKASMTVELRDFERFGFCLPKEYIIPSGEEMFEAINAFAQTIMNNRHIPSSNQTISEISSFLFVILHCIFYIFGTL